MAVREGLLALLDERPSHGYQLKTSFEAALGGAWPLNVGQVYQTLDRLERDGMVCAEEGDGLRSYTLTADGAAELGAWWDAEPGDAPLPRDELLLKVLLAVPRGREHALGVISAQRDAVMTRLQQRRRGSKRGGSVAAALVADAVAVRAEADLRWLDLCEERLAAEPDPIPDHDTKTTTTSRTTRGAR